MFRLRDKFIKSPETLKRKVKEELRKHKIGIRGEISENLLKEVFFEVKERIKQKTEYKVNEVDFPKDYLFAWVFWNRDWRKFLRLVFLSQSMEREKTQKAWNEEYPEEKPTLEEKIEGTKSVTIPLMEETFFLIGLSSANRESLRHEVTHYFEVTLNLPIGSLKSVWK